MNTWRLQAVGRSSAPPGPPPPDPRQARPAWQPPSARSMHRSCAQARAPWPSAPRAAQQLDPHPHRCPLALPPQGGVRQERGWPGQQPTCLLRLRARVRGCCCRLLPPRQAGSPDGWWSSGCGRAGSGAEPAWPAPGAACACVTAGTPPSQPAADHAAQTPHQRPACRRRRAGCSRAPPGWGCRSAGRTSPARSQPGSRSMTRSVGSRTGP
mmetsp:Transcript_25412/g.64536  ORF Transcript_25412/g.64536 Transcript_25412/m.64536 type:complete len:211 (+) Transcript_25412:1231-1863(+)